MTDTPHTLQKLKVLIAEDNEINKLIVVSMLSKWGCEFKNAHTGYEVLDLVKQEDFDLILMDIQMPEKDGIEATVEIRNLEDSRKKNIPIIALTANALMGLEQKYFNAGMNAFLAKPFTESQLLELVNKVISSQE